MSDDNYTTNDQEEKTLIQQLDEAKSEAEANLNGWKRAQADLLNFQAGQEKKSKELVDFAREVAVAKLLPSLDSLGQALRHMPEENEELRIKNKEFVEKYSDWKNGIAGLIKQLDKALEELGVQRVEALGKKFDPNFHEAIKEIEGGEDGVVVEEYVPGYMIGGKVVRPSGVGIGKKK
jgi:molecular chaperone GrpE